MFSLIESNTSALLSLALDAATMRQQAISHNIANANAPGFRPLAVSFEEHLAQARESLAAGRSVSPDALADARPALEPAMPGPGADGTVSLDMQLARLTENTLHHQALLKALNHHYLILASAISEGKR